MKIKAFNILNSNGNPAANQIEILVYDEDIYINIFQSYKDIVAIMDYNNKCLKIDKNAYSHSATTTKYFNMWIDSHGIDHKEVKSIISKGGGILKGEYKDLNIIISGLN